jgi:hypothetical protein
MIGSSGDRAIWISILTFDHPMTRWSDDPIALESLYAFGALQLYSLAPQG